VLSIIAVVDFWRVVMVSMSVVWHVSVHVSVDSNMGAVCNLDVRLLLVIFPVGMSISVMRCCVVVVVNISSVVGAVSVMVHKFIVVNDLVVVYGLVVNSVVMDRLTVCEVLLISCRFFFVPLGVLVADGLQGVVTSLNRYMSIIVVLLWLNGCVSVGNWLHACVRVLHGLVGHIFVVHGLNVGVLVVNWFLFCVHVVACWLVVRVLVFVMVHNSVVVDDLVVVLNCIVVDQFIVDWFMLNDSGVVNGLNIGTVVLGFNISVVNGLMLYISSSMSLNISTMSIISVTVAMSVSMSISMAVSSVAVVNASVTVVAVSVAVVVAVVVLLIDAINRLMSKSMDGLMDGLMDRGVVDGSVMKRSGMTRTAGGSVVGGGVMDRGSGVMDRNVGRCVVCSCNLVVADDSIIIVTGTVCR